MAQDGEERRTRGLAGLIVAGSMLAACVLVGLALGYVVDAALGTTPLFILVGLALGIVAAGTGTYRALRDYLKP